ncbi:MAG TPA: neutral/alkaline non-lysosomal ceramidase N-terminal domain-containing protein [Candidatus Acidoferrum sp.]|nr:neutral/alkaline non-lysosomal ceramidase N-terminal domain-containing protein [Candidatus Acidoferrum sp.]
MKAFCAFTLSLLFSVFMSAATDFRIGAAAVRITPDQALPMAGYYSTRLATGTHDDLFAKALVMECDGERAALVVCDLLTLTRGVVAQARELIAKQTGIPADRVMISATHTHTGPVLSTGSARAMVDSGDSEAVRQYTAQLPTRIAVAVQQAAARLASARVSAATEKETNLSHNRRFFLRDGTVGWNPGKLNTNIVKVAGPIDPEVTVLCFDAARTNLAAYVNFAMHPDTTGGTMWSADYMGELSRILGNYRGSNFITVFANGACGDINHVDVNWADPQKGHIEAARLGTVLAGDVFKAFTQSKPVALGKLRSRSEIVTLDLAPLKTDDLELASNIVARIGSKPAPKFLDQVFALKALDVAGRKGEPYQVEVQVIALGDEIAWVSLPGEIFVELGLDIKAKSPFKHTLIAELANGSIGYIPTRRAYDEGNYEPTSARCAKGSGERVRDAAIKLLRELKR